MVNRNSNHQGYQTHKKRISSLIETQENQQKTMVHIVSILNLTRYETQVNRQWINIIFKGIDKTQQGHKSTV